MKSMVQRSVFAFLFLSVFYTMAWSADETPETVKTTTVVQKAEEEPAVAAKLLDVDYDVFATTKDGIQDPKILEDIEKYCGHYDWLSSDADRMRNFEEAVERVYGRKPYFSPDEEQRLNALRR